jgi:hypothetical protein
MKRDCFDIGTIQAFLDGELEPAVSASVSSHIAACDACAMALADAEEESAFVFAALDREMNTLVPTQRLWTRINDSIQEEKHHSSFWNKAWAFFGPLFTSPSFAMAAAAVVVVGFAAVVLIDRNAAPADQPGPNVARIQTAQPAQTSQPVAAHPAADNYQPQPLEVAANPSRQPAKTANAYFREEKRPVSFVKTVQPEAGPRRPEVVNAAYLPGEESYVKTIADLSKSVSNSKNDVMRPSEQISYARDLALVTDSIEKMRREVRKNPKNESAKQILYASYQNKIDLLNSVAQREDLVALK